MLSSTSTSAPSSLRARRLPRPVRGVPALRSLPPFFNVKLSTVCPEGRRVDSLFPQSPHQYHSMGLTFPLFAYSYVLFCTTKTTNPFPFLFFRTLCTKHPGWGIPVPTRPRNGWSEGQPPLFSSQPKEATQRPFPKNAKMDSYSGGDTVSTEAVAARRHAGTHLPVTWWKLEMPTTTWHLLLN
jgi:hypothetical protein